MPIPGGGWNVGINNFSVSCSKLCCVNICIMPITAVSIKVGTNTLNYKKDVKEWSYTLFFLSIDVSKVSKSENDNTEG